MSFLHKALKAQAVSISVLRIMYAGLIMPLSRLTICKASSSFEKASSYQDMYSCRSEVNRLPGAKEAS
jgi:hypothetical protein